jgi:hypothetical protein
VISNRDIRSMRSLDLWLQYVDTQVVVPLFDEDPREYSVQTLVSVDWSEISAHWKPIIRDRDTSALDRITSRADLSRMLKWLYEHDSTDRMVEVYNHILSDVFKPSRVRPQSLEWRIDALLDHLRLVPFLAARFTGLSSWSNADLQESIALKIQSRGYEILQALVLSADAAGELVVVPFQVALQRLHSISFDGVAKLVELCALTIQSPDLAMDLLLNCLESESIRLMTGRPAVITHFTRNVIGVALEHISEAKEQGMTRDDLLHLRDAHEERDGYPLVEVAFRIDAKSAPQTSAHVRFTTASVPENRPAAKHVSIDAIVIQSQPGSAKLKCFHPLPIFVEQCSWTMTTYAPFVTSQTMLSAMRVFASMDDEVCALAGSLLGLEPATPAGRESEAGSPEPVTPVPRSSLNASQKMAVNMALESPLVLIWGPPGTGKTQTIVETILRLQDKFPDDRILVTAPTHNAVDNVMRRYLVVRSVDDGPMVLRVSTEVSTDQSA